MKWHGYNAAPAVLNPVTSEFYFPLRAASSPLPPTHSQLAECLPGANDVRINDNRMKSPLSNMEGTVGRSGGTSPCRHLKQGALFPVWHKNHWTVSARGLSLLADFQIRPNTMRTQTKRSKKIATRALRDWEVGIKRSSGGSGGRGMAMTSNPRITAI